VGATRAVAFSAAKLPLRARIFTLDYFFYPRRVTGDFYKVGLVTILCKWDFAEKVKAGSPDIPERFFRTNLPDGEN
jgi:hypothetical protein